MKSVLLAFLAVLPICSFADEYLTFSNGYTAHLQWTQGPNLAPEESKMELSWENAGGPTSTPSAFDVSLYMPKHGHGAGPVSIDQEREGLYKISQMYFTMPGEWEVRVTIFPDKGVAETKAFTIPLESSGHGVQ